MKLAISILIIWMTSITCVALTQQLPGNGKDKDQYRALVNQANNCYDKYQLTKAKELYQKALSLNPEDKYVRYKLQDIKTLQEVFQVVEKYDEIAQASGVMPQIIENKVLDENVSENKVNTLTKNKLQEEENNADFIPVEKSEVATSGIVEMKKEEPPVVVEKKEVQPVKKPVVKKEQPKEPEMTEEELEEAYRAEKNRLMAKYEKGKTVENYSFETRKIRRTIIKTNNDITIYLACSLSYLS